MSFNYDRWFRTGWWVIVLCILAQADCVRLFAAQDNSAAGASVSPAMTAPQVEKRLQEVTALLLQTRRQLEQSRDQMNALTQEIEMMRRQMALTAAPATTSEISSSTSIADAVARQAEEQQVQQEEIRQHEQTKVETSSKYALRLNGLVLFNAYSNSGVVDNVNLPSIAFPREPGVSHGSVGATVRQTVLGLHGTGPTVFSAHTVADLAADFFSEVSYDYYGNSLGNLRLRRADVGLEWKRDAVHVGVDGPLISPNSPVSYASVGVPALAWSGNLWNWSTQVHYTHTVQWSDTHSLELHAGLWDAPVVGLNTTSAAPVPGPGELSRRPGLEGRIAYRDRTDGNGDGLILGVGGYAGLQRYSGNVSLHTWAVTGDWQVPLTRRLAVSGEIYRGVGLGGFGGGAYKDVLIGTDPITGAASTVGLDAVGGWGQIKARILPTLELHAAYGQDGGFAADFRKLELYGSTYPLEQSARERMMFGNLVYRPKTYLIFSPEIRRVENWQTTGPSNVAIIFTLSAGYQF
jgi:hypothetical protein